MQSKLTNESLSVKEFSHNEQKRGTTVRHYISIQPGPRAIDALRTYKKKLEKLFRGSATELEAQRAFEELIEVLRLDNFVDSVILEKTALSDDSLISAKFIDHEAHIIADVFSTSIDRSRKLVIGGASHKFDPRRPYQQFIEALTASHEDSLRKYRETMELGRREKKTKRKKIRAGIEYTFCGILIFIANGCTSFFDNYRTESLTLGVGMTLKGCYDIRQVL
jgi:hypothetical protein